MISSFPFKFHLIFPSVFVVAWIPLKRDIAASSFGKYSVISAMGFIPVLWASFFRVIDDLFTRCRLSAFESNGIVELCIDLPASSLLANIPSTVIALGGETTSLFSWRRGERERAFFEFCPCWGSGVIWSTIDDRSSLDIFEGPPTEAFGVDIEMMVLECLVLEGLKLGLLFRQEEDAMGVIAIDVVFKFTASDVWETESDARECIVLGTLQSLIREVRDRGKNAESSVC